MTAEAKTTTTNEESQQGVAPQDDFDTAFDEAVGKKPDAATTTTATADEDKGGNQDETKDEAGKTGDAAVTDKSKETQAAPVVTEKSETDKLRDEFTQLEQRTKSWEGRLSASDRENKSLKEERDQLKTKLEAIEKGATSGNLTDQEVETELKTLEKEFPDHTKLLLPAVRKLLQRQQETFDKRLDEAVDKRLKPVVTRMDKGDEEAHYSQIRGQHSDFAEAAASKDMQEWIASKPSYLRPGLQNTLRSGNAQQVIDLLTDFKSDRKAKADADAAAAEEARKQKDKTRTQKAADAAAVTSRSGGPQGQDTPDPKDFDGGWEDANKA